MTKLPPGRYAYYQEELDELLSAARDFIGLLKRDGQIHFDREWLLEEHPTFRCPSGIEFEAEIVLAAARYMGLVRLDRESDGWIEVI